eukprot:2769688-Karenia_brevis.AAC.1
MDGIQVGVDRSSTLALLSSRRIDDVKKGMLRIILAGAVRTNHNLFRIGQAQHDTCPYCGQN